jgi:type IV pilus assembly protein PilA
MKDYLKGILKKKEGFTLVELLIVIAIIAILAAIAIPQFTKYKNKAYDSELAADAKNAYTASVAYLTDFPNATINDQSTLSAGGYARSANVVWETGSMTTTSGSFTLVSTAAVTTKNTAQVFYNGNIDIIN